MLFMQIRAGSRFCTPVPVRRSEAGAVYLKTWWLRGDHGQQWNAVNTATGEPFHFKPRDQVIPFRETPRGDDPF
jgi:hypothetical protein